MDGFNRHGSWGQLRGQGADPWQCPERNHAGYANCTAGKMSFWYSVSSELSYDFLTFYVDGQLQDHWSGTVPWTQAHIKSALASHTFTWEYSKDVSVSVGFDTAWIDEHIQTLPATG